MKLFLKEILFILLMTICCFVTENSYSQQPLTRKLSFFEGLSSDVVYDLFVDNKGLLYLGTEEGLMTYNGVHFEKFEVSESIGNAVNNIQQDKTGTIWCKNFANQLFYVKNNELIADKNVAALLKNTDANLIDYFIGKNCIYIITQKVLYQYSDGKIKQIYDVKNNNLETFTSIVYDKESLKLYISSTRSLFTFRNNILIGKERISSEQKALEIFKGEVTYCTKALDQNCVIGKRHIDLKNSDLHQTFLNRMSATTDNLWLCTNKGLYEFDEKKGIFKNGFLKDSRITDVVKDLEGNHWISTLDEGIYLLPSRKMFELEVPSKKKRSYTRISKGPNGNYFVGTNDGSIFEITDTGKTLREYQTNWDNTIEFIDFVGDTLMTNYGFFKIGNSKIFSNKVYFGKSLKEDSRGNLLIASSSFGGIMPKTLKGAPNFVSKNKNFRILHYGQEPIQVIVFRNRRAKSVLYQPLDQEYYYGFVDGLFVYDSDGNEEEVKSEKNESIVAADMIYNEDGSIWVASSQKGILLL